MKKAICILILTACAGAQPPVRQLRIGTFQFRGTTDPNCGFFCSTGYDVAIDASALSSDILSFSDEIVCIGAICQHSGPVTTHNIEGFCANCVVLTFPVLKALPGQHILKPGQSVPIDLRLDRKASSH